MDDLSTPSITALAEALPGDWWEIQVIHLTPSPAPALPAYFQSPSYLSGVSIPAPSSWPAGGTGTLSTDALRQPLQDALSTAPGWGRGALSPPGQNCQPSEGHLLIQQ